jgi:hypothetical protein
MLSYRYSPLEKRDGVDSIRLLRLLPNDDENAIIECQLFRNGSGQAHFTVKMPVRKEGGMSAQLSILYSASIVKRVNTILYSLNYII